MTRSHAMNSAGFLRWISRGYCTSSHKDINVERGRDGTKETQRWKKSTKAGHIQTKEISMTVNIKDP